MKSSRVWYSVNTDRLNHKTAGNRETRNSFLILCFETVNQETTYVIDCFETEKQETTFSKSWFETVNRETSFWDNWFESMNQETKFLYRWFETVNQETVLSILWFETVNQETLFLNLWFESKNQETTFLIHWFESVNQETLFSSVVSNPESMTSWLFCFLAYFWLKVLLNNFSLFQWIDVTDVPQGHYILQIEVNPSHLVKERNYENNILQVWICFFCSPLFVRKLGTLST